MRRLFARAAIALLIFACIPLAIAEQPERLTPADIAQLTAKAEAGDAVAMRALGDAYRTGSGVEANLDNALSWYERAGAAGNSTALYNMGIVLSERGRDGDLPRALDVLKRVLPAYEQSLGAGHLRVANVQMVLGRVYSDLGRYEDALTADGKALAIFEKELGADSVDVAKIASNMGIVYERLGRYDEALRSYNRSLAILSKGRATPELANLYVNLGIVYESLGRLDDALAAEGKALRIRSRESGADHPETALVLANMGSTLDRLGRAAEAIKAYEKALPILAEAFGGDHPLVAVNRANLGTVYASVGRYDEALKALNTALPALIKGYGVDHPSVAYAYYNSGLVYQTLSQFDAALASFQKTLPLFEKIYGPDHTEIAQVRAAIGNVYSEMDRDAEAVPELEKALPVLKKAFGDHGRVATVYNNLGAALHGLGRNREALAAYDMAIAIETKLLGPGDPAIAVDLVNKASVHESLGETDEAAAETVRALALYSDGTTRLDAIRKAYWALARALDAKGDKRAAIIFAKRAVNAHQELRLRNEKLPADLRSSLARGLHWVFDLLADQEIADGAFAEAQYAASLIKEEELFDFTARGSTGGLNPKGQVRLTKSERKILDRFEALLKKPAKATAEIQALAEKRRKKGSLAPSDEARFGALSTGLDDAYSTLAHDAIALFAAAEDDRKAIQDEQLASNAQHGEELRKVLSAIGKPVALYQAVSADARLHIFVSSPGHETVHREVDIKRSELALKVYKTVSAVETRDPKALKELESLYSLLIKPVEKDLADSGARVVMLNLSGFLRYVPYAALSSGSHYLVEDYALALYTPAAGTQFSAVRRDATGAGFGVTESHGNFAALPGVRKELEAIFSGKDGAGELEGTPLFDAEFDEAALKAALRDRPRFLHIASHFKFVPGNENNSFLLLGTGGELMLNRLRTDKAFRFAGVDLLALSACETARGGGAEGEEIESFGALAQMNGASAVMATLWQIADDSTAKLMADFYSGMIKDGLDKATALQRAQVAMIKGSKPFEMLAKRERAATVIDDTDRVTPADDLAAHHPYYWAPFILMGNWL
jgi:CHAT domain-containing protein/TPR repeat protein